MADHLPIVDVLDEANRIIQGNRADQYGGPENSMQTIAGVWTALLSGAGLLKDGATISADLACVMMAGMKLGRLITNPEHHDSQVDTCGYIARMRTNQQARQQTLD